MKIIMIAISIVATSETEMGLWEKRIIWNIKIQTC